MENTNTIASVNEEARRAEAYVALAAAQSEMGPAYKDCTVVYGGRPSRYASLESVMKACRRPLNAHGFAQLFDVETTENSISVTVRLLYKNGYEIASKPFTIPTGAASNRMNIQQAFGSASTYARRYAVCAFLGIAADEDDDGNGADYENSAAVRSNRQAPRQEAPARPAADLIARAEAAARQGMDAYQSFWKAASTAEKSALTTSGEHTRIKDIALTADAAAPDDDDIVA